MQQLKPYIAQDEKELALRIVKGERTAFEELFNNYYKSLYILGMKYLKDPALAEDAIQEIFLKIWTNRASINPESSLKGYLHTIAKNYILNVLRNNTAATKKIIEYTQLNIAAGNSEEITTLSELSSNVYKSINSLPKKRRVIAKLKLYKGLDNQAIASKLKLSINTVKAQYSLALKHIRAFEKNI